MLRPNSKMEMTCTFAPTSTKHCVLKLPCYYKHEKGDFLEADSVDRRSTLTVLGNGSYGEIKADVDAIDFDVILVNTVTEREITLFNSSNCDVFYSLEICQSRLGGTMEHGHDAGIDGGLIEDFDVKPNNLIGNIFQKR